MSFELVYTSAPAGIRPGSSGFCTVAATPGIPRQLIRLLESLTAYQPVFAHFSPEAPRNPVGNFHCINGAWHIFGRIHGAGLDYTGRSNKFADFLLFSEEELQRADATPSDIFRMTPQPFRELWNREPEPNLPPPEIPHCRKRHDPAFIWQQCCGDAAGAAVLAHCYLTDPRTPVYLLYDPLQIPTPETTGMLAAEAIALLEPEIARRVTFHSCFTQNPPQEVTMNWRFVPVQSEMAAEVRDNPRLTVFQLGTALPLPENADTRFQDLLMRARHGGRSSETTAPAIPAAEAPEFRLRPGRPQPPKRPLPPGAAPVRKSENQGAKIAFHVTLGLFALLVMTGVVLFYSRPGETREIAPREQQPKPVQTAPVPQQQPEITVVPEPDRYSQFKMQLEEFGQSIPQRQGEERLRQLQKALDFAKTPELDALWAPPERVLIDTWRTDYNRTRKACFDALEAPTRGDTRSIDDLIKIRTALETLKTFDAAYPPQSGIRDAQMRYESARDALGTRIQEDMERILREYQNRQLEWASWEQALAEACRFNREFPDAPPIPTEKSQKTAEKTHQTREADTQKQQEWEERKKQDEAIALPDQLEVNPDYFTQPPRLKIKLPQLPNGCRVIFDNKQLSIQDNIIVLPLQLPEKINMIKRKNNLEYASGKFRNDRRKSSMLLEELKATLNVYNQELALANDEAKKYLSGNVLRLETTFGRKQIVKLEFRPAPEEVLNAWK